MAQATTALASTARTGDTTIALNTPTGIVGAIIVVDVTLDAASAAITPTVRLRDEGGNYTEVYWTAAAAFAAVGEFSYIFYPGILAADVDITEEMSAPIPAEWQLFMNHADSDAITYSVRVQWLP